MPFSVFVNIFKKYWWVLVIIACLGYTNFQSTNASKLIKQQTVLHDREIAILNETKEKEKEKHAKIIKEYEEQIEELDLNYDKAKWALRQEKKKNIEKLSKEPEKLKEQIKEIYEFKYIPTSADNPD